MDKDTKAKTMETFARHEGDTGSPEVQVAILSDRISELTEHLREHKHDEIFSSWITQDGGATPRLLAYIRRNDYQRYMALTDRLNIRRK